VAAPTSCTFRPRLTTLDIKVAVVPLPIALPAVNRYRSIPRMSASPPSAIERCSA
jgi:hypothetical protein